jgi:hypothetical protein
MSNGKGGFIGQDGLNAPDEPTGVTPTAGNASVSVAFTAPTDVGASAITGFVAQVSINDTDYSAGSNTGTSSPIVVSSLTNNTAATAKVWAINAYGTSAPSAASASFSPTLQRAIRAGGRTGGGANTAVNVIDYRDITSAGNFADFGNLSSSVAYISAVASQTRAVFEGGLNASGSAINVMEYITIASTGNVIDFGDGNSRYRNGASGNNLRGMFFAASNPSDGNSSDSIDYITIATTGNVTDFGNASTEHQYNSATASATRAILWCINIDNRIDYFTIASTGNATDFGNHGTRSDRQPASFADSTRGCWAGGYYSGGLNNIEYITIATLGNSADFGDLTAATWDTTGTAGLTRGLILGGYAGARVNTVEFVTIQTTGNMTDFGNLTTTAQHAGGTSSAHGGL